MVSLLNSLTFISSPLDQFEIRTLFSLDAPILANMEISFTNMLGFYLIAGVVITFGLNGLATNCYQIVSNNWSISRETIYATVHSIVENQINRTKGQIYFLFIFSLFVFILVNNLIGMIPYGFASTFQYVFFLNPNFPPEGQQLEILCVPLITSIQDVRMSGHNLNSVSEATDSKNEGYASTRAALERKLNWLTGFSDAEGCFSVALLKKPGSKVGWIVQSSFQINLHLKDRALLDSIKLSFGGVGNITKCGKKFVQYRVTSVKDLVNFIIPHFERYPLITQKRADYILFKSVVELMFKGEHLTETGLNKIVSLKASINNGLSEELKAVFPSVTPAIRPLVNVPENINPYWMAGFTSGDGCFYVSIIKSKTHKIRQQVTLYFILGQHIRDVELLKSFIKFFGCGKIKINSAKTAVNFEISKSGDIINKIIPFFNLHQIEGVKSADFSYFSEIVALVKDKAHLTFSGLVEISKLKSQMNRKVEDKLLSSPTTPV